MGYFAVIDTETNWADQVMSMGSLNNIIRIRF